VTSVQIANGQSVNVNVPGDQLFLNPSGSVLGSINQLITAVQNNSGISAAVTALGTASNEFDTQRLSYGTALNELQTTGTFLTNEQLQLSTVQPGPDRLHVAARSRNRNPEPAQYPQPPSVVSRSTPTALMMLFEESARHWAAD
jgi:flagellar hook-associated protein 3 FlgL